MAQKTKQNKIKSIEPQFYKQKQLVNNKDEMRTDRFKLTGRL